MHSLVRAEAALPLLRGGTILPDFFSSMTINRVWCTPGHVFLAVANGLRRDIQRRRKVAAAASADA